MTTRKASRNGQRLDLTAKEFSLLALMLKRQGQVLSRTLLAEQIWGMNFDSETNVVEVTVRRLRAKVDDAFPDKLIHTVRGMGYVLAARPGRGNRGHRPARSGAPHRRGQLSGRDVALDRTVQRAPRPGLGSLAPARILQRRCRARVAHAARQSDHRHGDGACEPEERGALLELIESNLEEVRRLSSIVSDMLFLSHADSGGVAERARLVDLAHEVHEVAAFHEVELERARLRVEVHGDARLTVASPLLRRALSNLIGNAIRHARPGARSRC